MKTNVTTFEIGKSESAMLYSMFESHDNLVHYSTIEKKDQVVIIRTWVTKGLSDDFHKLLKGWTKYFGWKIRYL